MTKSIDFYFDFISPYSYLAHKRIINLNLRNICYEIVDGEYSINFPPFIRLSFAHNGCKFV